MPRCSCSRDEDGDRPAGAVRRRGSRSCSSAAAARSRPARRWSASSPSATARRRPRTSAGDAVDLGLPSGRRRPVGAAEVAERARPTCPRCCSATTSTPRRRGQHPRGLPLAPRRARRRGPGARRAPSQVLSTFADFAELSRNRPAGEEAHVEHRVHSPASSSTPTCRAWTSSAAGCRSSSAPSSLACCGHYGVDELDRTPQLEDAVFRVFLAQQRSAPDVALVTALLQRWMRRAGPERRRSPPPPARCSTGWCWPPSCASRRSATWPAACGSAGSTSRSSTPSGPRCWRRCATGRALAGEPDAPGPRRAHRRAGRHPRADRPVPRRPARERHARARADARGAHPAALPRVRADRPARRRTSTGGRSPSPTTRSTSGHAPGLDDRHGRRAAPGQRARRRA